MANAKSRVQARHDGTLSTGFSAKLLRLLGAGFLAAQLGNAAQEPTAGIGAALGGIFLLGGALSLWVGNFLLHKEPEK